MTDTGDIIKSAAIEGTGFSLKVQISARDWKAYEKAKEIVARLIDTESEYVNLWCEPETEQR